MFWLMLLQAVQAPPISAQEDVLANEVLDFRGRREECEYLPRDYPEWHPWRCDEIDRDETSLRTKLKSRPDLLARLDKRLEEKEKHLIIMADERRPAEIRRVVQEGTVGDKAGVTVIAEGDANRLGRLIVQRAGQRPVIIRMGEPIDYPDLRSMRVSWFRQAINVEMPFGIQRPWCFVYQDGRSKLTVAIDSSRVSARRQDTVNCSLVSRDVNIRGYPAAKETRP